MCHSVFLPACPPGVCPRGARGQRASVDTVLPGVPGPQAGAVLCHSPTRLSPRRPVGVMQAERPAGVWCAGVPTTCRLEAFLLRLCAWR